MLRPPYPSARDHFYIPNVDDRDYLEDIVRATVPELMSGKSKAKRKPILHLLADTWYLRP